ncbi:alpha/beta fold hydrolase [Paractinoplanes ovalisporus]|nr:alpha/beta hydrolase [Actinoplanes ovalisporus]
MRQVYHVAGQGPVCVAHSGGPGMDAGYLRSAELERHFTMVYLEPIGTGTSDRLADPAGYVLDTYVRYFTALIDHLAEPRVHVLGHSYGGFVALRYALENPDRIAGLILYDTSPVTGPDFWAAAMAGVAAYPNRYPDVPEAAAIPAAFHEAESATDDEGFSAGLRITIPVYFADYWARRAEFAQFVKDLRVWSEPAGAEDPAPFDLRPRLAEILAPTVVIAGAKDFIGGQPWAGMLHSGISGSNLVVLPDSGHFGHIEQPEEFLQAVLLTR